MLSPTRDLDIQDHLIEEEKIMAAVGRVQTTGQDFRKSHLKEMLYQSGVTGGYSVFNSPKSLANEAAKRLIKRWHHERYIIFVDEHKVWRWLAPIQISDEAASSVHKVTLAHRLRYHPITKELAYEAASKIEELEREVEALSTVVGDEHA